MEITQDIDNGSTQLEVPHFDDELTVVTAQPVVPLEDIEEQQTHRKRWLLAGAFALAMLLGAGSALLAIRIKRQSSESVVVQFALSDEEEPAATEPDQIRGGETPAFAKQLEHEAESFAEEPETEDLIQAPVVAHRTEPKRPPKSTQRVVSKSQPVKNPVADKEDEPRATLVDQWEESRSRRVWRRERRERRQREQLFRIGEIFEGRRRSERPN